MARKQINIPYSILTCNIPSICDDILNLAKNSDISPLYKSFIKKFYRYIPVDYAPLTKLELFDLFAHEAFEFFKNRKIGERKISINTGLTNNEPDLTILLINDDKPFIIDSLSCLATKLNLQPKFIFHPVIACKRNNAGDLLSIEEDSNNEILESLIFIKILGNFDQHHLDIFKAEINKTLDQVEATSNVWPSILTNITNIAGKLEESEEKYTNYGYVVNESIDFLYWLAQNNFTFLGQIDFTLDSNKLIHSGASTIWQDNTEELQNIIKFSTEETHNDQLIILGRINSISSVHRGSLIDYILVKNLDRNGHYIGGTIIIGLYSAMLSYQSIKNIPILREKLNFVLKKAKFSSNGYNYKKLKLLIEFLPREAVIQTQPEDLYCMALHMLSSMMSRKLKLFIQQDQSGAFLNFLIFLPRERLIPSIHNAIIKYLSQKFAGAILANYITEVVQNFSYLFVTIAIKDEINFTTAEIEQNIDQISSLWDESLYHKLAENFGEYKASSVVKLLTPIFPTDYKNKYNTNIAVEDISYLREASRLGKFLFNLVKNPDHSTAQSDYNFSLKIYSPNEPIALYNILPLIENLGFKAIDERSFEIHATEDIKASWLYEFILISPTAILDNYIQLKNNVEEALEKMRTHVLAVDSLSKLIVLAGLNWTEVKLLKALTRYLHQTGFAYGKGYVQLTLIKHSEYTKILVEFFKVKFDPNQSETNRKLEQLTDQINDYLNTVLSSSEDKVLRHMFNLLESMVRTNYYQQISKEPKDYISFKFNSPRILGLVRPVPYAEIFVYSNDFEAIHLRGGRIARGGLRWSDRGEDYRTEVLGLMKAQMTKNSVIIPVGSKGGFFLLFDKEDYTKEEYNNKVIECYQNFLRGMLDITDNIIEGKITKPKDVVRYDEDDPYLVVAADKGTATFSDYANSVSVEYNFWLADAFASGGSAGYDHKKMGITAKGAWISVSRHFEKMGIDVQTNPITIVGIGDMSGDVFGNGMLLSKVIKLVAAFNHMHIFLDPTPEPEVSYLERKRLFNLPYSKWSDYNNSLISQGGGIFERSAKLISLSAETKNLLDIDQKLQEITPDDLIRYILKARVDLIWNGGIGTYIKATNESNLEIGDKANDYLRCNGSEIRAKVIAEGGNLGVSQQGRIEYSQAGGLINTDFIDNSAGVDCSDHEVNIKIALNSALRTKKLSLAQRNKLLAGMSKEIEELVLLDNYKQTQAITIAYSSPAFTTEIFSELINNLEAEKLLDRKVEFLPSNEELKKRASINLPMTRPELAVLLAYSKMSTYHELGKFDLFQDSYFEKYLIDYFPRQMQDQYKTEILEHTLKEEIIRTVITNKIVNQLGGAIINNLKKETSANLADIVATYVIVCEIFNLDEIWSKVESLKPNIDYHIKIDMFTELTKVMRRGSSWFIKNSIGSIDIQKTIKEFAMPAHKLSKILHGLLSGDAKDKFDERIERYIAAGVDSVLAIEIAMLDSFISIFDIIFIARIVNTSLETVAKTYFLIGSYFHIDWLRKAADRLIDDSYWNRLSIQSIKDDLYERQKNLVIKITGTTDSKNDLEQWMDDKKVIVNIFTDFVRDIKLHENINLNMIILASKKFEMFLRKLN